MFDDYSYIRRLLPELPEIRSVVRVRDRFKLDELIHDVRGAEFPCIAVEISNTGVLDLEDKTSDKTFHTFHVLFTPAERDPSLDDTCSLLDRAKRTGRKIMRIMAEESVDPSQPCYGLDRSNIHYAAIGPIGLQAYGYTFNFVMTRDHE